MIKLCPDIRIIGLLIAIIGSVNTADAKRQDTLEMYRDTIRLKEVIINGELSKIESDLISKKLLTYTSPTIIDAIDRIPGFFKVQSNNYPLTYRGQYGNRLRIEQNGNRRSGVTPEGGYLAEDINPGEIGEINIVNGAEKAIYGSGSSGGVLQLNDSDDFKRTFNRPTALFATYGTNNSNRMLGINTGLYRKRFILKLSARHQNTGNYQAPGQQEIDNSSYRQNNLSLKASLKDASGKNQLFITQQFNEGSWNRPKGFQNNPLELRNFKNRYNYQTNVRLKSALKKNLKLENRVSLLLLETDQTINSFSANMQTLNLERIRTYTKNTLDYEGALQFKISENSSVKSGIDLYQSNLKELYTEFDHLNETIILEEFVAERREYQGGLFALLNHKMNKVDFMGSFRLDYARIGNQNALSTFHTVTGGTDVSWLISKLLKSTWSVGRYFRYPTQQEAVGVFFGGRGTFLGNPDINPEYSHQLEWKLGGTKNQLSYQLSAWYHHFNERITAIPTRDNTFTYMNVENARTIGAEWIVSYQSKQLTNDAYYIITFSGTSIRGDELTDNSLFETTEPLVGIPPTRVRLFATYIRKLNQKTNVSIDTGIEKIAAFDRLPERFINQTFAVVPTAGYWLINAGIEINHQFPNKQMVFNIRGTNLTNSSFFPFGTRVTEMGRNMLLSIRYEF